jgi:T-complex protein 1 subunit delta
VRLTPQAAKAAGGPTRVEKAKIGLIQFHISPPKADIENTVVISDYAQVCVGVCVCVCVSCV